MANLKELRNRIDTDKSIEKITSAMKMVAASRLRKSQQLLSKSSIYYNNLLVIASRVGETLRREAAENNIEPSLPKLITGTGKKDKYLLIVFASDKGLCGGYNVNVAKEAVKRIDELKNKEVKIITVGKRAKDILKRTHAKYILESFEGIASKGVKYDETLEIFDRVANLVRENDFDVCEIVYSKFVSALTRKIVSEQVYPMTIAEIVDEKKYLATENFNNAYYEYEPEVLDIYEDVLYRLEKTYFYQALINSQASEHGARMTSMDNATRNAKDMISKLRLKYNRTRQSAITTELTEIISGAEAI